MRDIRRLNEKKTWTEEDGRAVVAAWRASGESMAAFAREQGFGDGRLRWWRDRLRDAGDSEAAKVETRGDGLQLVRVNVEERGARSADAAGAWEILTPRGQLRVHQSIGAGELRVVLEALMSEEVAR
jgi:transposase-like protein